MMPGYVFLRKKNAVPSKHGAAAGSNPHGGNQPPEYFRSGRRVIYGNSWVAPQFLPLNLASSSGSLPDNFGWPQNPADFLGGGTNYASSAPMSSVGVLGGGSDGLQVGPSRCRSGVHFHGGNQLSGYFAFTLWRVVLITVGWQAPYSLSSLASRTFFGPLGGRHERDAIHEFIGDPRGGGGADGLQVGPEGEAVEVPHREGLVLHHLRQRRADVGARNGGKGPNSWRW